MDKDWIPRLFTDDIKALYWKAKLEAVVWLTWYPNTTDMTVFLSQLPKNNDYFRVWQYNFKIFILLFPKNVHQHAKSSKHQPLKHLAPVVSMSARGQHEKATWQIISGEWQHRRHPTICKWIFHSFKLQKLLLWPKETKKRKTNHYCDHFINLEHFVTFQRKFKK